MYVFRVGVTFNTSHVYIYTKKCMQLWCTSLKFGIQFGSPFQPGRDETGMVQSQKVVDIRKAKIFNALRNVKDDVSRVNHATFGVHSVGEVCFKNSFFLCVRRGKRVDLHCFDFCVSPFPWMR